jgi:ribosomal protein S18 acetylase RimI-like enzyme
MSIVDYDAVIHLWETTEGIGLSDSDTRPAIKVYLVRNPGLSFVVRDEGKIVGAVLCGHDGRRGYLHHLVVEKAYRGRGLGKRLVNACITQLRQIGIQKCNIFLFADNAAGQAFWQRIGWLDRSDLRVMQKVIDGRE